jgi:hypothetical protein
LQEKWVDNFKNLEIVETKTGYKKVTDVTFINPMLLENDSYFDSIYYLFDKFNTDIPSKETIKYWSSFVSKWEYAAASFINNEDVAKKIQDSSLKDFDEELLKKYYDYLLEEKHGNLFTEFKLLPNIEGNFQYLNILKCPQDLDEQIINIGKSVIPDAIAQLVNTEFSFGFKFDSYKRKDFSNSINSKLNTELTDNHICLPEIYDQGDYIPLEKENIPVLTTTFFLEVLKYCKLHNNPNSQSKPSKLMGLISAYYGIERDLIHISVIDNKDDDLDVRQAQKKLVKIFFNSLLIHVEQWVEKNIDLLYDIATYPTVQPMLSLIMLPDIFGLKNMKSSNEARMLDLIGQWQQSGLSQKAWCLQQNIAYSAFQYWHRRLKKLQHISDPESGNEFVQLMVKDKLSLSPWCELILDNQKKICFHQPVSASFLRSLLD